MAANPVLVDSSWYIRIARERRDPLMELAVIAAQRDVATCGMVRSEVGRGLRRREDLEAFQRAWDIMRYVTTDARLWRDVEETAWLLDRQGQILPLTDVIIGCCARRIGALVLTFDRHFDLIPGIRSAQEII